MKKTCFLIILFLLLSSNMMKSEKYFSRNGHINFISHTPLLDLEADNHQVASMIDFSTGEIVFNLLMKSFKFKEALAEEHFNENYLETEKFPKSKFNGKILNYKEIELTPKKTYNIKIEGDLLIHGVTQKIKTNGTIQIKDDMIIGKCKFQIDVYDYNVKIPNLVKDKVNNLIPIEIEINYTPYKEK